MCSYIYAPFLPNFSLGVLNPHVLVCGFLLYGQPRDAGQRGLASAVQGFCKPAQSL